MSGMYCNGFESLESRRLLSVSPATAASLQVIGASSGLTAAANPYTTGLEVDGGINNAYRDTSINLKIINNANGGAKETSFLRNQFAIFEDATALQVETSKVQTSGGGDTLSVKPVTNLKSNTLYRVEFNQRNDLSKITNVVNEPYTAATYTFTTGTFYNQGDVDIKFSKQIVASHDTDFATSSITIGPDNRLYVGTLDGYIYRYNIASDGTLTGETRLDFIRDNNGGARFVTGLVFDPRSTDPNNPVLWVSHGQAKFGDSGSSGSGVLNRADNYTGKISRVYGTNFSTYEDVIVNIPRSVKDHLNNQLAFDPLMRNLYFVIPSHSAMGRADSTWGNRPEELSTAAMFRLQLQTRGTKVGIEDWLAASGPINLDPNSSRPYNFAKGTNPLRFFATGIRNAYDLVWHSNGKLYVPANSSAAGGNTPLDPTQSGTQLTNVQQTIEDYLYDVVEGGYYGQPNPSRGQYILNGGNPTSGTDVAQIGSYPVGTQPDSNYRGFAYDFGKHQSPNGVIEYKSDTFGGRLKNQLIVARYSGGDDLLFLKPKADGTFDQNSDTLGTTGLTGLTDVIDLIEDTRNGNLYTITLNDRFGGGRVRLHKPLRGEADTNLTKVSMYAAPGDTNGAAKTVTLTNTDGTATLNIDVSAIRFTGIDRRSFIVSNLPAEDFSLRPGQSFTFNVKYVARAGETRTRYGNLAIATDDPDGMYATVVQLRGFLLGVSPSSYNPSTGTMPMNQSAITSISKAIFSDEAIDEGLATGLI